MKDLFGELPEIRRALGREIFIVGFAGGGGSCEGIKMATGRSPDEALNHDPEAIAMHMANHPETRHWCQNIWQAIPSDVAAGRPIGGAWFSPDCFPAGTLVLTRKGYCPIEDIEVGEEVLTHRMRWRRVTETSSTRRPLMSIKGHGHPGLAVSPEHPFFARLREDVWRTSPRGYQRTLGPADWVPASMLDKGWYWATPTSFPAASAPDIAGRGMNIDTKLMWLVGRYLGDGWTRLTETRAELVITCGKHEADRLRDVLASWPRARERAGYNELAWSERHTGTAYQFAANHRGLVAWLRHHFGHRAEAKRIPGWALGLMPEHREALLAGYLSADGWKAPNFSECRTVSKALAFGVKALLNSLGKTVIVHQIENSRVIAGREVNARDIYMLRWRGAVEPAHAQTFTENGLEWCPIRSQTDLAVEADVFNIGVEEDESYVVEGIVVHNCKHFSKAKGGKPRSKNIRDLAWVVLGYAELPKHIRPRVIWLENVEEFKTWGPLLEDGSPDPARQGEEFERWCSAFRKAGYKLEMREIRAMVHKTPTIRKRLYIIARCDGQPIVWPEETNGPGKEPYRTAANDVIDWSIPCKSIFDRKRPLADATMRRIAAGLRRFVLENPKPFIVTCNHSGNGFRGQDIGEPFKTVTAAHDAHGLVVPVLAPTGPWRCRACDEVFTDDFAGGEPGSLAPPECPRCGEEVDLERAQQIAAPHIQRQFGTGVGQSVDEPAATVMPGGAGKSSLVSAVLAGCGGRAGQSPPRSVEAPMATATAKADQILVHAHLMTMRNAAKPFNEADKPTHTITAGGAHLNLIAATMVQTGYGERDGQAPRALDVEAPLGTVVAGGAKHAAVSAFLAKHYGGHETPGWPADAAISTVTTQDHHHLVTSHMVKLRGGEDSHIASCSSSVEEPLPTVTASGTHVGEVRAFLVKYFSTGTIGQEAGEPLHTVTSKDRFGLVTVEGQDYEIVDIGMRMLTPRELFRAQGFPDSYIIDIEFNGKPLSKAAQVRMAGNSVCPPVAAALVAANYQPQGVMAEAAE